MAMEVRCHIRDAHELPVLSVAFNDYRNEVYSGGKDCLIKIWDVESGSQIRVQEGHQGWVTDLLYSDLVKILFSCSLDGRLLAWSDKGKLLQVVEFGGPIFCLAWDMKGKHIVAGGRGVVQLYRVIRSSASIYIKSGSSNQKMGNVKIMQPSTFTYIHKNVVEGVCCSMLGNVFTCGHDRCICLFESGKPGTTMRRLTECHEAAISAACFDKDGKNLVTGSYDGTIKIWSNEGYCLDEFPNVIDCVTSIAYIPSTKTLWVTGRERFPIIIDTLAPANVTEWVADCCGLRSLPLKKAYHASDMDLALGVCGSEIIIWRFNRFGPHRVLRGHMGWVECLLIVYRKPPKLDDEDEDETKKSSAGPGPSRHVQFDGPSTKSSEPETPSKPAPRPVAVPQPGSLFDTDVYSAGADGSLLKWKPSPGNNCDSWTLQEYAPASGSAILCMTYDQTLDVLVTGSEDTKLRIWSLDKQPSAKNGPEILRGHEDKVVGVCVHNLEFLISASLDRSIKWWNLPLRIPMDSIDMAHDLPIEHMEYSPMRGEIATCGGDKFFKVWNAQKKKYVQTISGTTGNILTIKWCNFAGGFWTTATDEGEVAMWNPDTGAPMRSISLKKKEPVTSLFVDEYNKMVLMSTLSDPCVRGYNMDLNKEVCTYLGHTDQVHSIIYFPQRKQYLSGSWDNTIRCWLVPDARMEPKPVRLLKKKAGEEEVKEVDPLHEEPLISTYEKEYPLIPPKTLQNTGPVFSGRRPDSRDSTHPAASSSLLTINETSSSSRSSIESHRSSLNLAKRLEDMEMILRP